MTREEFLHRVEDLLEEVPGTFTGEEILQDLEAWESLTIMEFMAIADESFGVVVPPQDIASCTTVSDLLDLLASHYQSSPS